MSAIKQSSVYTQNIGHGDRLIRYIVGVTFIGLFMAYQGANNRFDELLATLALLSVVVISTAIIRWDPIYAMLGLNTVANARKRVRHGAVNVGMADGASRLAIGSIMIGGFMLFSPTPVAWTVILPLLAIPIISTAIIGWCPVYALSKVDTNPRKSRATPLRPKFISPALPRPGRFKAA